MTNEREALEKIRDTVCETGCRYGDKDCTPENCIIREFKDIATQALAPQKYDVLKCEFYDDCNGHCGCNGGHKAGLNSLTFKPICKDNPNCYYKQLLAEQAKNKKLVEALEKILEINSNSVETCGDYPFKMVELTQEMALQALNEVKE